MALNLHGIGMTSQRTRSRLAAQLRAEGIANERILELIRATPRHAFIEEALAHRAYENTALPIGFSQTISQPLVVALMTEALLAEGRLGKALEIGTGSGYQTAILAQLAGQVCTVERIAGLHARAQERLAALGYQNIRFRHGDGAAGWAEEAPFDAILLTAAPCQLPEALLDQLAPGGRLLAPVGDACRQELLLVQKSRGGRLRRRSLGPVKFVPLVEGEP